MTSKATRNEQRWRNALLQSLVALDMSEGVVEQDGPFSLTKRAIGTASPTDIPTYADMIAHVAGSSASLEAAQAIAAGDFVNVYPFGGAPFVRKANATDPVRFACGFARDAIAIGDTGIISFSGINPVTVSAALSVAYLSGTAGGYTGTAPSGSGEIVQQLGPAIPGVGVIFTFQPFVIL